MNEKVRTELYIFCLLKQILPGQLQIGYFLPQVDKLGEVQYESPADVFLVLPGQSYECWLSVDTSTGRLKHSTQDSNPQDHRHIKNCLC